MGSLDIVLRGDPNYEKMISGRWADDCWLLQPAALKELRRHLSETEVRASVRELTRLYPSEVCARPLENREIPTVLVGLLSPGFYWHAWPPLFLGLDLTKCPGWELDRNLVGDLRRYSKYWQRRIEIGVWAGMNRKGLHVERLSSSTSRTPDFLVDVGGQKIAIEVKTLGSSAEDDAAAEVAKAFTDPMYYGQRSRIGRMPGMGKRVLLRLEPDLAAGLSGTTARREAARSQLLTLMPMASDRVLDALEGDDYPFDFDVPGLGHVWIVVGESADTFEPVIVNLPETPLERQVERALRAVRNASGQCLDDVPLVVVLHSATGILPARHVRGVLGEQMLLEPDRFQGVDAVLLHNHYRDHRPEHRMEHDVVSSIPPWSRLKGVPRDLAQGILTWTSRL